MSIVSRYSALSLLLVFGIPAPAIASSFQFDFNDDEASDLILIWSDTGTHRPLIPAPTDTAGETGHPTANLKPASQKPVDASAASSAPLGDADEPVAATAAARAKATPAEDSSEAKQSKKKTRVTSVPPGFEGLMEPQTTQIDVYYGDSFLVSVLASFTPTDIEFLQPTLIVARIPDLLETESILAALSAALPNNSQLLCLRRNQTGCGQITAETVEVIFDDSRFRADLFIAPRLLAVRTALDDKYLPASEAGFSLHQLFNASLNGVESNINSYNVGSATTLSYKESRLFMQSNYTDSDTFTIDTLALQREFRGREYQLGIFRSNPGNMIFISQKDFAGLRLSSSLDTRNDLDQSTGNDLQVFLSSRSRVDLLKDDRLISSRVYETGNQIIDTTELPGGAYDIVLRIRDSQGRVTEETRFYIKSSRLPPLDQTLYFFEAGERVIKEDDRTLPQSDGEIFVRGGVNLRITSSFGGEFGVALEEKDSILEAGFFQLGRSYELHTNVSASSQGDFGAAFTGRIRLGAWTLDSSFKKTWADENQFQTLIGEPQIQGSLNLSAPLSRGTLSISSRYNKRADDESDRNLGIRFDFRPVKLSRALFHANLQLTENNDNLLLLLSFQYRFDSGRWHTDFNPQLLLEQESGQNREFDTTTNLTSSWRGGDRYLSDVNFSVSAINERSDSSLETSLDIASSKGHLNVNSVYTTDSKTLSYAANISTSVLMNKSSFVFGGKSPARSAIVVNIEGDIDDAYFDVLINQSARDKARIGAQTVIGLTPYVTYDVYLRARGSALINFNDQVQTTTLYPGNVVTMNWQSKQVVVVFGQISDHNGNPVANGLIKGASGLATTDEFGLFQAELSTTVRKLTVQTRKFSCDVNIPDYEVQQNIVFLGELTCY